MYYQRPEPTDLANVAALNRAFLSLISRFSGIPGDTSAVVGELAERLLELSAEQGEQLAGCPFLIFSLGENDPVRWRRLFEEDNEPDLVDEMQRPPEALSRLVAATLGFLWELSKRNAYAARLVCGASLAWCETLAASTPIRLVHFASSEPELLVPRFLAQKTVWQKLLGAGTSADPDIRRAAQIAALQTSLTTRAVAPYRQLSVAACRAATPTMRVAEERHDRLDD